MTVGDQSRQAVRQEVVWAAMTRVLDLAEVLELIIGRLDGLLTHDKFCWSRHGQLRLSWPHFPLRVCQKRDRSVTGLLAVRHLFPVSMLTGRGGSHETVMVHTPRSRGAIRRAAALGSGVSVAAGMDASASD